MGQLVGPSDLEALQEWVIGRGRRHNRLLHGWGIGCGLTVGPTLSVKTGDPEPWFVTVDAGYALASTGDEIVVPSPVRFDVRQPTSAGADPCAPPADPWCAPVRQRRDPARTYYLAIRYDEELCRPVLSAAGGCGCGCDDSPCEFSRVDETFQLALLDDLPDCYEESTSGSPVVGTDAGSFDSQVREPGTRECPDCCSPWVVLAVLTVDERGTVSIPDPSAGRRFVVSFATVGIAANGALRTRELTAVERAAIKATLSSSAEGIAEGGAPSEILQTPATELRGGSRSTALRSFIGDRTVADLAQADVEALVAAGREADIKPEDVHHLHAEAAFVMRVAQP